MAERRGALADRAMNDAVPRTATRPGLVLGAVALLLLAVLVAGAVLDPDEDSAGLSSWSADGGGARGYYETADRLGWRVARRTEPLRGRLPGDVVWVALAPALPPTSAEVHALLEAVRGGAGLLVALPPGQSPLTDSLGLRAQGSGFALLVAGELDEEPAAEDESWEDLDEDAAARSATMDTVLAVAAAGDDPTPGYRRYEKRYAGELFRHLRARRPWPSDTVLFLAATLGADAMPTPLPVAVGLRVGRGRVVAVAEPRIFTNALLRDGAGVLPVRMLEWLAAPGERVVVFDEFHHGYGAHASLGRAVRRFLGETTVGRTVVQLLLAAALLVLALGARPFAPHAPGRIERRSPIEHVGALARAYQEVNASRVAARRLARGLRRRLGALGRPGSDADFLRGIADRHPAVAGDVALVLAAIDRPLPPERFVRLAPALARIERTIAT